MNLRPLCGIAGCTVPIPFGRLECSDECQTVGLELARAQIAVPIGTSPK